MEITKDIAEKVLSAIDAGLVKGVGDPIPGQMCVEAAVNYAMGLPHGDDPPCVASVLRVLKIRLNDKKWSSPSTRAAGLRRLGLAQLGSAGVLDTKEFIARLVAMTIGKIVPRALRAAASKLPVHAEALEAAASICEREPTRASALKAKHAAYAAADAAYAYAAADAAAASAAASAASAASAAYADADAASAASAAYAAYAAYDAYAAYAASAAYAAAADARDKELAFFAEEIVQILVEMNAPGCQWLYLAPLEV